MVVRHDGLVYQTAFFYSNEKPWRIAICKLFWLFVGAGLLRICVTVLLWLIYGIFMAIAALIFGGGAVVLAGYKVKYTTYRHPFVRHVIIAPNLFAQALFSHYESVPMNLPVVAGWPIRPIYPIALAIIGTLLWHFGPATMDLTEQAAVSVWESLARTASMKTVYEVGGTLKYIVFPALGFAAMAAVLMLLFNFLKSEVGELIIAYLKAKKDRLCPIAEVV